jgi:hypothetical protein
MQIRSANRPVTVSFKSTGSYFHSSQLSRVLSKSVSELLEMHYWATSGEHLGISKEDWPQFMEARKAMRWSAKTKCWFRIDELEALGLAPTQDVTQVTVNITTTDRIVVHRLGDRNIFRAGAGQQVLQAFPLPAGVAAAAETVPMVHVLLAGPRWKSGLVDDCLDGLADPRPPAAGEVYVAPCAAAAFGLLEMFQLDASQVHREEVATLPSVIPAELQRPAKAQPSSQPERVQAPEEAEEETERGEGEPDEDDAHSVVPTMTTPAEMPRPSLEETIARSKHLSKSFIEGLVLHANSANREAAFSETVKAGEATLPTTSESANSSASVSSDTPSAPTAPILERHWRENYAAVTFLRMRRVVPAINASHVDFISFAEQPEARMA